MRYKVLIYELVYEEVCADHDEAQMSADYEERVMGRKTKIVEITEEEYQSAKEK